MVVSHKKLNPIRLKDLLGLISNKNTMLSIAYKGDTEIRDITSDNSLTADLYITNIELIIDTKSNPDGAIPVLNIDLSDKFENFVFPDI